MRFRIVFAGTSWGHFMLFWAPDALANYAGHGRNGWTEAPRLIWTDPPISVLVLAALVFGYALWQFFKQLW